MWGTKVQEGEDWSSVKKKCMQDSGETCYDQCCRDSSGTGAGADRGENYVAKIDKKNQKTILSK